MQIVNGKRTQSYLSCINSDCKGLPTGVLKGQHPRKGYAIQILYCESHENEAMAVALKDFIGILFEGNFNPPWLRKNQENEMRTLRERRPANKKES